MEKKTISLKKLLKNPSAIFEEVYKYKVEYTVTVNSEDKFKISPLENDAKKVIMKAELSHNLEKFV